VGGAKKIKCLDTSIFATSFMERGSILYKIHKYTIRREETKKKYTNKTTAGVGPTY
jgi:hypothetical protein